VDLIKVHKLHKTYQLGDVDLCVLKGVSLSIRRGEMVALMGSSGSGKTTLMNILGCLDRPTKGQYWFEGQEISGFSNDQRARMRNQKIGFVFQNFSLLPRTSTLENVVLPMLYRDSHDPASKNNLKARELLQQVGLIDRLNHEPSQLSGGEQQRVAIARAFANQPELLLADEPTGNLDTRTGKEILDVLQHFNKEQGVTILLVTHDAEVAAHADRVIHVRDGIVVDSLGDANTKLVNQFPDVPKPTPYGDRTL